MHWFKHALFTSLAYRSSGHQSSAHRWLLAVSGPHSGDPVPSSPWNQRPSLTGLSSSHGSRAWTNSRCDFFHSKSTDSTVPCSNYLQYAHSRNQVSARSVHFLACYIYIYIQLFCWEMGPCLPRSPISQNNTAQIFAGLCCIRDVLDMRPRCMVGFPRITGGHIHEVAGSSKAWKKIEKWKCSLFYLKDRNKNTDT